MENPFKLKESTEALILDEKDCSDSMEGSQEKQDSCSADVSIWEEGHREEDHRDENSREEVHRKEGTDSTQSNVIFGFAPVVLSGVINGTIYSNCTINQFIANDKKDDEKDDEKGDKKGNGKEDAKSKDEEDSQQKQPESQRVEKGIDWWLGKITSDKETTEEQRNACSTLLHKCVVDISLDKAKVCAHLRNLLDVDNKDDFKCWLSHFIKDLFIEKDGKVNSVVAQKQFLEALLMVVPEKVRQTPKSGFTQQTVGRYCKAIVKDIVSERSKEKGKG